MSKRCGKCKRKFPLNSDYFHVSNNKRDGFASVCKECGNGRFTRFHELEEGEMFCGKCDKILPYTEEYFPKDKNAKDGLRKTCLVCSGRRSYGKRRKVTRKKLKEGQKYNKKPTIEEIHRYCADIGGECISDTYKNSRTKMVFKCSECKELFEQTFSDYRASKNPYCGGCSRRISTKRRLEEKYKKDFLAVKAFCEEMGVKLLSNTFKGVHEDLLFECTSCQQPFKRRWVVIRESKSTICVPCSREEVANRRKYTLEEARGFFEREGNTPLFTEYENNKQRLKYICDCGKVDKKALSNFIQGQRCKECGDKKGADTRRTPYKEVRRIFEDGGCTLISSEFIHSNIPLDYICECGNPSRIKLPSFIRGVRCRSCGGNEKPTIKEVSNYFEKHSCKLKTEKYTSSKTPLEYVCECGEHSTTTWWTFRNSPYKKCRDCANRMNGERIRGSNHPHWNPELSDEERDDRRHCHRNKTWRIKVYERDGYTCQTCLRQDVQLNAHHIEGYNWCKERRFDVSNGISLCVECHLCFHSKYGYGDNTQSQWDEFYANQKGDSEMK